MTRFLVSNTGCAIKGRWRRLESTPRSRLKSSTKIRMNIMLSLQCKRKLRARFGAKANHKRYDQSTISFSAHGYRADAPRRARFRQLFAPAQGQHHFHRDSDR